MIAALSLESGIAPAQLLRESPEMIEALVEVAKARAKAADPKAAGPDPSGLARRMTGGGA